MQPRTHALCARAPMRLINLPIFRGVTTRTIFRNATLTYRANLRSADLSGAHLRSRTIFRAVGLSADTPSSAPRALPLVLDVCKDAAVSARALVVVEAAAHLSASAPPAGAAPSALHAAPKALYPSAASGARRAASRALRAAPEALRAHAGGGALVVGARHFQSPCQEGV
jgi:hypothetical protein